MPLFSLKSISAACALEDADRDYGSARRTAQYRVSARAIYFPAFPGTRYLPFRAVTKALTRNTSLPLTGCCGKALPMVRLRLYYDGEFYQDFLFEKPAEADRILDDLSALCPETPVERETRPLRAI